MSATERHPRRLETWHAALLALAMAAVYAGLGQHTFYREDGFQLVYHFLLKGNWGHDIHPLYLPFAGVFVELLSVVGIGTYRAATLFSAAATGGGVFLLGCLARRMDLAMGAALTFVLLVAFCPAVLFFATVVEFHGFFFFFACLCFFVAEGLIGPPPPWSGRRAGAALLLAGCTFAAALAHSTGNLLLPLLAAWIAARAGLRRRLADLLLFGLAHAGLWLLLRPLALRALGMGSDAAVLQWVGQWLQPSGLAARAWHVVVHEVVLPYLPLSLLVPLLVAVRRTRWGEVGWALVGFLPYFLLCVLILADRQTGVPILERGSYLLPLAIPAAWIVARALPTAPRGFVLATGLVLVAGLAAFGQVMDHDERPGRAYGRDLRAVLPSGQVWLLAGTEELPWVLTDAPRVRPFYLVEAMAQAATLDAWLAATAATLDGILDGGGTVWLSERARSDLENPALQPVGRRVLGFLASRYSLRPVMSGRFAAEALGRKR